MDTWYLAGNCIDETGFRQIVDSLITHRSIASNIWLKRNPLRPSSAAALASLILQSEYLDTLDLDQTELGDAGVSALFSALSEALASGKQIKLRHIYLNAVGLGSSACVQLGRFLGSEKCQLQSLFIANNPIGDRGALALADGLARNTSLVRLMADSTGLTATGASAILAALTGHQSLIALSLGQSFATADLGGRYNYIDDAGCLPLIALLQSPSSSLRYLVIDGLTMSHAHMNQVYVAVMASQTLFWLDATSITPTVGSNEVVRARMATKKLLPLLRSHLQANVKRVYDGMDYRTFEAEEKRWLASPREPVRRIDSVYRNRDAGMARRGLMKLDKWWDGEDGTLEEVMAS